MSACLATVVAHGSTASHRIKNAPLDFHCDLAGALVGSLSVLTPNGIRADAGARLQIVTNASLRGNREFTRGRRDPSHDCHGRILLPAVLSDWTEKRGYVEQDDVLPIACADLCTWSFHKVKN